MDEPKPVENAAARVDRLLERVGDCVHEEDWVRARAYAEDLLDACEQAESLYVRGAKR